MAQSSETPDEWTPPNAFKRPFFLKVGLLYQSSRCGNQEAYSEFESLASSTSHEMPDDALIVRGYLGDLLMRCRTQLVPLNERRAKLLLSEFSELSHDDEDTVTCPHLQHLLAMYYMHCCSDKETEMVTLCEKAAAQGNVFSHNTLGVFYTHGMGTRQNSKKGVEMYTIAATIGCAVSQCNLGKCYQDGEGCEENLTLSLEWFQKSAEHGYVDALYNLGIYYQLGRGVGGVNDAKAAQYFQLAAEQGDAAAQYNLAWCYRDGRGVVRDDQKAVHLCLLSAKQGDPHAAELLGQAYEEGWGVDVNIVEAMRYYQQAASGGDELTTYAAARVLTLADSYREAVST